MLNKTNPDSKNPPCEVRSSVLQDNYHRQITYLRVSVTDRCNLRCRYCMPEQGIPLRTQSELLSWKEMERLVQIFTELGIRKVRLTGGEPFVRKGILDFLAKLCTRPELSGVYVTTNGIGVDRFVPRLKEMGISGINLSLDTLRGDRFRLLARRDAFEQVMATFNSIIKQRIPLKINAVIQEGWNTDEIIPLSQIAERFPVEVRFIETMPFRGSSARVRSIRTADRIRKVLLDYYGDMKQIPNGQSTAKVYRIPHFQGKIGIIAGYSRLFCGSCNRIRITPAGRLKTCLYGEGVLNLKSLIRRQAADDEIKEAVRRAVFARRRNGFQAAWSRVGSITESMAAIGG